ncbi:ankyrin repeat domain-containing protein 31-like [Corythoichthys intestinalis]|uniref:ankyrin repeat domain-containing protein 31-like n=1 Tax=Corythoichthys intestinalis TaxID=161448 RepID=UPI0025A56AAA|nr:ankyrin repeat domain-containing protein 31-like [Corythoichthys intestinalis]
MDSQDMFDPVNSNCFTNGERSDPCNQECEPSSDDSISLLQDLDPSRGRGTHVGSERHHTSLETNTISQKNKSTASLVKTPPGTEWGKLTECVANNGNGKVLSKIKLYRRDSKGETILHRTCRRGDVTCVKTLIQNGICVNMKDYAGWTALHEASAMGHVEVVRELLNAGADVNVSNHDGINPLHDAVAHGYYQVVEILLRHGSKPCDRNILGLSALDMAEREDIKELLLAPSSIQVQPGELSTEASCRKQLPSLLSNCPTQSNTTENILVRVSADGDRAIQFAEVQMRKNDTATDNWKQSVAIKEILKDVEKKQMEMSTWALTQPEDGVRYYAAFTEILAALIDVLARQRLEKHQLVNKYRSISSANGPHVVKIQLISLASRQRNLVAILERQLDLIRLHDSATFTSHPTSHMSQAVQNPAGQLIQKMTIPSRGVVKFLLKGRCVLGDESVKDSLSPELRLQSIRDNDIPVSPSPSCIQDEVVFHENRFFHPLDKRPESECSETALLHGSASSTQETVITVASNLNHIMKIKTVYLVPDEELIPNAVLDNYWKMLVQGDTRLEW